MKKTFTTLLIAIGFIISCYSVPQFILDNQVTLTPEQKAEYERKVKERPDEYSFNPMHVGDKWWYSVYEFGNTNINLMREVIDSTQIDGYTYYKMWGAGLGPEYWLRNEGDSIFVYDQFDADNNPNTHDLMNNDFTMTSPGIVYPISLTENLSPWDCFPGSSWNGNVFSIPTTLKIMTYHYPPIIDSWTTWIWARKFGFISYSSENVSGSLIACKIDNIIYGDSSVVSVEESLPICFDVSILAYPNPFREETTISFKANTPVTDYTLEIYNVKGQKIRSLEINSLNNQDNTITWDGTDNSQKQVSSGIYYLKIKSDKQQSRFVKCLKY